MNDFEIASACDPFGLLACKIVEQAIHDYRALLRGSGRGNANLEEIRRFLRGPWCDVLLSCTDVNGEWVLKRLDKEAEKIEPRRRMLTVDGRTATVKTWCRELGVSDTNVYRWYHKGGRKFVEDVLSTIKKEKGL